jgi:hypothetical protein
MIAMGRKPDGAAKKTVVSVSIQPQIWQDFREIVDTKHPDGDTTASAHLETMVKREICRIKDEDTPDAVDVDCLRRKLADVKKQGNDMLKELEKRPGVLDHFDQIAKAYSIDLAEYTNVPEVVQKILKDKDVEGSPLQEILKKRMLKRSDLVLLIHLMELKAEDKQITAELLNAQTQKYCNNNSQNKPAPGEQQPNEEAKQTPTHGEAIDPEVDEEDQKEQDAEDDEK